MPSHVVLSSTSRSYGMGSEWKDFQDNSSHVHSSRGGTASLPSDLRMDVGPTFLHPASTLALMARFITLISVLGAAVHVSAWGNLGHETVGFVAEQFLAPKAATFVHSTLNATWNFSLGPAAIWADQVKGEAAFKWSANLHFVDAEDSPLTGSCSVQEQRDCSNGQCILTAIANFTTRVVETC
ncbi:hypothetical protein OH76DRAFT_145017 [Lentinus brumalis]|uniref:Uncharacterized protein n=1 Tax=Lentinus brumalis TaxID=2498619 RepID=A0A371CP83_9APHY|nr:hypothetical protein OH76DRAFT_145017 [Polyporus brumalis]